MFEMRDRRTEIRLSQSHENSEENNEQMSATGSLPVAA
jgi:hypothetical protein